MNNLDKIALGIASLEVIVLSIGRKAVRKRNREFMQKYYGVSTVDELLKKMDEGFFVSNKNVVKGN